LNIYCETENRTDPKQAFVIVDKHKAIMQKKINVVIEKRLTFRRTSWKDYF